MQHAACEFRIALDRVEHGLILNKQQQRISQHLGAELVALAQKHRRLAETIPRTQNLHHLFRTRGRVQRKLHASDHDNVKPLAGVVAAKQHRSGRRALFRGCGADRVQIALLEILEQRQIAHKIQRAEEVPVSAHGIPSENRENS